MDETIRAGISELEYAVKYRRAFYGKSELGWVIEVAPYHVSANVLFLGGADFDDPPPLGSVGRTRYVKVRDETEASAPGLLDLVKQAGHIPGWK